MKTIIVIIILMLGCSTEPVDCAGVESGTAFLDNCEQCVGGTTGLIENYLKDCNGDCGGSANLDDCNECSGGETGQETNYLQDCLGYCGGNAIEDCSGVCQGTAQIDECGICGGDNSSCSDCAGVPNGESVEDNCGTCDSDTTNDCVQDCAGTWGGDLLDDDCGICEGDNSSCSDCAGVPNGNAMQDNCGVCDYTVVNDCIQDCAGVWGGSTIVDCTGICGGEMSEDLYGTCCIFEEIDCSGICISSYQLNNLGDGECDHSNFAQFNCEKYECDIGDCGNWNGSDCIAPSAISLNSLGYNNIGEMDYGINPPSGYYGHVYNLYGNDPSFPSPFYWGQFYDSVIGSYYLSFCIQGYDCYDVYYTTYQQPGEETWPYRCFEFVLQFFTLDGGSGMYEWNTLNDNCAEYYSNILGRDMSLNENIEEYSTYYINYQNEMDRFNINLQQYNSLNGKSSGNLVSLNQRSFELIPNPKTDERIHAIDLNPNVVVLEGDHYIMKYVRRSYE